MAYHKRSGARAWKREEGCSQQSLQGFHLLPCHLLLTVGIDLWHGYGAQDIEWGTYTISQKILPGPSRIHLDGIIIPTHIHRDIRVIYTRHYAREVPLLGHSPDFVQVSQKKTCIYAEICVQQANTIRSFSSRKLSSDEKFKSLTIRQKIHVYSAWWGNERIGYFFKVIPRVHDTPRRRCGFLVPTGPMAIQNID